MTENQTEQEPIETEPGTEPDSDQTEPDQTETQNNEAAKYRTRLRETETERDQLAAQLDQARRQLVERTAGLAHPAALWEIGTNPADLFTDDGTLDSAKLAAVTRDAAERLGLSRPPMPHHLGKHNGPPAARDRFADAFRPRDR